MTKSPLDIPINYWDLLTYLRYNGWEMVDDPASRYIVFHGPKDIQNSPIEIVFIRNHSLPYQQLYIDNALEILSRQLDKDSWSLTQDINTFDRDTLRIRVMDIAPGDTLPLRAAAHQINELKQLVAYSACSEIDRQPFYIGSQNSQVKNTVELFQFGHTFKGSFGFTIETPRLVEINLYKQISLLPEIVADREHVPFWRNAMTRIVRGLVFTQEAVKQRNARVIADNYETGLNANMCKALASMTMSSRFTLEYTIKWSSLKPPTDPMINSPGPVQISEAAIKHLEYAAELLYEVKPYEVTIYGRITELSAKESPLVLDTTRTVRIDWFEEAEGKNFSVIVTLSPEHYQLAIEAHKNWWPIEITGIINQQKSQWRFLTYSVFKIADH